MTPTPFRNRLSRAENRANLWTCAQGHATHVLRGILQSTTGAKSVSGRPEGSDSGGYDAVEPFDNDAWQDFTPWRPGDKSTRERSVADSVSPLPERGFRWTEDQPDTFDVGDRIGNVNAVGGITGNAVPKGSIGHVVDTHQGLFDETLSIRFDNGYTATNVKPSDVEHKSWW